MISELAHSTAFADVDYLRNKNVLKHFLLAMRQFALLLGLPVLIYICQDAFWWVPLALLQGFIVFGFSILLHEVIHDNVFPHRSATTVRCQNILGHVYASISGLSYSQFTKWHLDHHRHLGDDFLDPKKAKLSPHINKWWYKILYGTPALFFIYFRAVAKTVGSYSCVLRKRIKAQRFFTIGLHLVIMTCFALIGTAFLVKAYIVPVFIGFPLAFFINRMAQHYIIDPDDEFCCATLMRSNAVYDFLFLYSTYHLEHHYYPYVPFYNLKKLNRALQPFYHSKQIKSYSYGQVFYLWIFRNHLAHSKVLALD